VELSGFGNRKSIEMKNTVEKQNMYIIHCNYMGFKSSKNFLVFRIKM
jgi:hypothetical protein